MKVIVPVAPLVAPLRAALSDPAPMAMPVESVEGAAAVSDVTAVETIVVARTEPQRLVAELLLASPL